MKMAEIIIGMKLEDERTNEVVTVVEKNGKYKTVMVEMADGTTKSTSLATINKHFTEVVDLDDLADTGEVEVFEDKVIPVDTSENEEDIPEETVKKEKSRKKERKPKDTTELSKLLPFDTLVPAHGGLAVKIGRKRLFEVTQNTKTGVFTIASHLPTLDSVGVEYEARKGYGVIKVATEEEFVAVVEKFKLVATA